MFNSNEKLFLSKHTCDQATFCYKRGENWPFSLEFYVGTQKAEELKKHIENITPLAIEVERGNKQYRYVIEEVHSCKIGENVLQIEFSGEAFKNSEQFIDQHRDSFTMTIPDCTYILPRLPQSKPKPSPAVKPSQDTQDKSNATGVNNILMCSINEYSFKNYKLNRPTIKFLDKIDEYIQLISANKESENLIESIKEVRTSIASELDNLPKYPDKLEADEGEIIKDYLLYTGKYFEFTSKILEKFGKLDEEDKETGEYLVVKMLKKFERNKDEIQASKEQKPVPEEAPSPATPQDLQAELNANKVSDINSILMCSKDKYSFKNYKSKGPTIKFSQAVVEEYVKFISENENSKKLIEEIKKLRDWVAFAQVENTQKFIDENNEVGMINNYLLYIQGYFTFTSNILSNLRELSEKEKSEGGDRLVEGQLKRIEKILNKNAQSQNERSQRRVHFANDVKNHQEETPVSHDPQTDTHEPKASAYNNNTSMYYALGAAGIDLLAVGVILCAVGMPKFGGIFIAGAVMCALIVGIGKVCEKVSEEKQENTDMSTPADVETAFNNTRASCYPKTPNR